MVCMSPVVTSGLIDKLAEDYDVEATEWVKELERCIEVIWNYWLIIEPCLYKCIFVLIENTCYQSYSHI